MDKITIQGLQVKSLIGVYDWEREEKQVLLIDVTLGLDLSRAAQTDDVNDTVHYAELALAIEQVCEQSEFQLLESLAAKIISQLFTYPSIENASVSITKPNIIPNADAVTVSLYREAS